MFRQVFALWLVLSLWLPVAHAVEEAAQVVLARGTAQALGQDGATRALARRDRVFVGDTLKTGGNGMLQVRFVDKALLTLRENSEFRIETYSSPTDGSGKVLMHLVEGGFRTITGSIGKGSQDAYKVTTGAASIGIRGTHYEVVQESPTVVVMAVWDGGIHVSNSTGELNLGPNADFSFSRIETGRPPVGLLTPPPVFEQGPAATQTTPASSKEVAQTSSDSQDTDSEESTEPVTGAAETADTTASSSTTTSTETAVDQESTSLALNTSATVPGAPAVVDSPNLTDTNPQLQEELTPPVIPDDPWTTKSTSDPRLFVAEFEQLQDPDQAVIVPQNPEVVLATIISPNAPSPYNFAANGPVSFEVKYSVTSGSTAPIFNTVQVQLDKNHIDLNTAISDIQEHLTTAGAPIGVRESSTNPGHLEFYTANADPTLYFELTNFDLSASSAQPLDVADAMGGLVAGAFASGYWLVGPMRALVVFGQDGKPSAFLAPGHPGTTSPSGTPTASLEVGRLGAATLVDYNPTVGGRDNISWGRWAASTTNPIHIYGDINTPDTVTEFEPDSGYWLAAEAANTADLTGTQTFQMGANPTFLGTGSDGAVQSMGGSFSVDFTTGNISGGNLSVSTANQNWIALFSGVYTDSHAFMKVNHGYISGSVNCANCVSGNLNGIFAAPGDRFAGGYSVFKSDQPTVNSQGVFLMERK